MKTRKEIQKEIDLQLKNAGFEVDKTRAKKILSYVSFHRDCLNVLTAFPSEDFLNRQLQVVESKIAVLIEKADKFFPAANDNKRISFLNSNSYHVYKRQFDLIKFILNK